MSNVGQRVHAGLGSVAVATQIGDAGVKDVVDGALRFKDGMTAAEVRCRCLCEYAATSGVRPVVTIGDWPRAKTGNGRVAGRYRANALNPTAFGADIGEEARMFHAGE
jgi:hypothetical protein